MKLIFSMDTDPNVLGGSVIACCQIRSDYGPPKMPLMLAV